MLQTFLNRALLSQNTSASRINPRIFLLALGMFALGTDAPYRQNSGLMKWNSWKRPPTHSIKHASMDVSSIVAIDIRRALLDYQIPSDEALQQDFEPAARRSDAAIETKAGLEAP